MRVDEYNDFTTLLARYRRVLETLERLGLRIGGSSRLRRYEALLQKALDDPRPAVEEDFVFATAFALREIDETIEIVDNLPPAPDAATLGLLGLIHRGTDSPDDEVTAAAREAQYELYLGSVFRRAGIDAVHGKPDLVAHTLDRDFFIEAKRPGSPDRVDDRVRSAVHQLRTVPKAGILALSLDQVIRPRHSLLSAPSMDLVAPEVARLVANFVAANPRIWRNRLKGEPVDAVLFTARVPARLEATGHLVLGTNIHLEIISQVSDESAAFLQAAVQAYLAAQDTGAV